VRLKKTNEEMLSKENKTIHSEILPVWGRICQFIELISIYTSNYFSKIESKHFRLTNILQKCTNAPCASSTNVQESVMQYFYSFAFPCTYLNLLQKLYTTVRRNIAVQIQRHKKKFYRHSPIINAQPSSLPEWGRC
jgi:hypothetical protein